MSRNLSSAPQRQYASSRKAKLEQKKFVLQILLFLLLTVGLVALFIFVALPTLIKFLSNISGKTPVQATDNIPVQVPFLSAPIAATSSASITLSGFSQKGYAVSFVDNGQPLSTTNANDDGSFQANVDLTQGDNKITVYATDQSNKQSDVSQEYDVLFNNQPPSLDISQPQDQQTIQGKQNQNLTIQGKTTPNTKVSVNGQLIFVKDDGTFSSTLLLNNGSNSLDIKAIDEAGNTTEKTLTVTFNQ